MKEVNYEDSIWERIEFAKENLDYLSDKGKE